MPEAGQNGVAATEIAVDGLGLGGGFDDDNVGHWTVRYPSSIASGKSATRLPGRVSRARPVPVPAGPPSRRTGTSGSAAPDRQPCRFRRQQADKHLRSWRSGGVSGTVIGQSGTAFPAQPKPDQRGRPGRTGLPAAGCPARPRRFPARIAPWRIRSLPPRARGSSGEPGTANTSRPASWAMRAVIRLPERRRRLHHHDAQRQAGDDAVAAGEVPGLRGGAERRFGDQQAGFGDAAMQVGVFRRVGQVDAAGDHGDGAAGAHARPRCAAASMPRARPETTTTLRGQLGGEVLRHALAVGRGVAPAHRRDAALLRQRGVAARRSGRAARRPAGPAAADSPGRRGRSSGRRARRCVRVRAPPPPRDRHGGGRSGRRRGRGGAARRAPRRRAGSGRAGGGR